MKTLTEKPADATHWSTRGLAKSLGMSQPTVSRIWKAFGLKPWVEDTFKLSTDPLFIDKVRDVVALYMDPPERAVVICVDEKTAVQALDRTQPVLPLLQGTPERRTHDYVRHGTIALYAALNLTTGMVTHQLTARHRTVELKKFLDLIEKTVPANLKVHVVPDNSSTHKAPGHPTVAAGPPPLRVPFHAHFIIMDEPRGAVVRRDHQQMAPPGDAPQRQRARTIDNALGRDLER